MKVEGGTEGEEGWMEHPLDLSGDAVIETLSLPKFPMLRKKKQHHRGSWFKPVTHITLLSYHINHKLKWVCQVEDCLLLHRFIPPCPACLCTHNNSSNKHCLINTNVSSCTVLVEIYSPAVCAWGRGAAACIPYACLPRSEAAGIRCTWWSYQANDYRHAAWWGLQGCCNKSRQGQVLHSQFWREQSVLFSSPNNDTDTIWHLLIILWPSCRGSIRRFKSSHTKKKSGQNVWLRRLFTVS